MPSERTHPERRTEIDRRIAEVIDGAAGDALAPELAVVPDRDDRRYGQLLAASHDAVASAPNADGAVASAPNADGAVASAPNADGAVASAPNADGAVALAPSDGDAVVAAATAIELLREYGTMRERLLVALDEGTVGWSDRELTTRLLASDFLHTSAYSTLGSIRSERATACVEAFAATAESIVEAFQDCPPRSAMPPSEYRSFADATAGALGRGAAVVGATLAGADEAETDRFATFGRGVAAARHVRSAIGGNHRAAPSAPDDRRLREFATRRLDEAETALESLSATAAVGSIDSLAAFVDADRAFDR